MCGIYSKQYAEGRVFPVFSLVFIGINEVIASGNQLFGVKQFLLNFSSYSLEFFLLAAIFR
jgi:hypothetical protein